MDDELNKLVRTELINLIKTECEIEISTEECRGFYGENHNSVTVKILLDGEVISESTDSLP